LKDFEKKKKQVLNSVREVSDSEEEDLKQLDDLRRNLQDLSRKLIEIELNQTEAFAEVIEEFITNYRDLDCQEQIRTFFGKCRQYEQHYHSEIQSKLLADADNKDKLDINEPHNERLRDVSLKNHQNLPLLVLRR
jgi:membrane protein involved in colicin uptake